MIKQTGYQLHIYQAPRKCQAHWKGEIMIFSRIQEFLKEHQNSLWWANVQTLKHGYFNRLPKKSQIVNSN